MTMTVDELADKHGISARKISAICRASGVAPLHYAKQGQRMVPVYDDDVLEKVDEVGTFGQLARALGTDAQGLATAIMARYPGGALGVPRRLRSLAEEVAAQ